MKYFIPALVISAFAFASCQGMSPDQKAYWIQFAGEQLANGTWTQEMYDQFMAALEGGKNWLASLGDWALYVGLPVVAAYFGINLQRGAPVRLTKAQAKAVKPVLESQAAIAKPS